MDPTHALEVGPIVIGLAGGLALFLYGMEQMTAALKQVAGSGMKTLLARLTTNRFTGLLAGAFVTAVIQSSSVTTVLVVGFISAGLMTLPQSIGVILGADIGTTITAQVIAFKVTKYALVLVALGFAMQFLSKRDRWVQYGSMVLGLGLIFFGMELMSDATHPLRDYPPFIAVMQQMDNPFVGILAATLFTGVIQSSSATMGVVIVLASQGFLTLEAGIALVFGANIGTCVTAMLAAIGKPREAVRAALVHVVFKVVGVAIWFGFIGLLANVARGMSPTHAELEGAARLAAETPRQIANAHTLFNVVNAVLFLPFVGTFVWLMRRLVPERPEAVTAAAVPRYLDDLLLDTPAFALDRVRMELRRLGERALGMVRDALPAALEGSAEDLAALRDRDDAVDALHGSIVAYLGRISKENLDGRQAEQHHDYLDTANAMESIGDMIETNVVGAGTARLTAGAHVSEPTRAHLRALHERVVWAVETAFEALDAGSPALAREVIGAKTELNRLADETEAFLAQRLQADAPDRLLLFRFETELIEYLKRVYYFAKRIAKTVAHDDLEDRPEAGRPVSATLEPAA